MCFLCVNLERKIFVTLSLWAALWRILKRKYLKKKKVKHCESFQNAFIPVYFNKANLSLVQFGEGLSLQFEHLVYFKKYTMNYRNLSLVILARVEHLVIYLLSPPHPRVK